MLPPLDYFACYTLNNISRLNSESVRCDEIFAREDLAMNLMLNHWRRNPADETYYTIYTYVCVCNLPLLLYNSLHAKCTYSFDTGLYDRAAV